MQCSICDGPIPVEHGSWTKGHNAQPINDGRCCRECNDEVVIPARLRRMIVSWSKQRPERKETVDV